MRLFGVVITTRRTIMKHQVQASVIDALTNPDHPMRQAVMKVARSATKDHISEWFEAERARFEALPAFEDFARQQREHDLAEAEKAQPTVPVDARRDHSQLRYGILGVLIVHGPQSTASIADSFYDWAPKEITTALASLVSAQLAEVSHGVYWAAPAGMGLDVTQEEARHEDPDS